MVRQAAKYNAKNMRRLNEIAAEIFKPSQYSWEFSSPLPYIGLVIFFVKILSQR
jgi:hypothetical protein